MKWFKLIWTLKLINYRGFDKTYIIAEIGVNHNGSVEAAIDLIDLAQKSGADAVKFQTFTAEDLARVHTPKVTYQIETTSENLSHFEMLKRLELTRSDFYHIKRHCETIGIRFISTPYSVSAVDLLEDLDVEEYKIASADIVDIPLLRRVSETKKPVILSLGMASLGEVEVALKCFEGYPEDQLVLLHCVSNYPCSDSSVNLRVIEALSKSFPYAVGFSDHTVGNTSAVGSVVLGGSVVEKHFTSDKDLEGPDHRASCDPIEFEDLAISIRKIELQLGSAFKIIQPEEEGMASISRKSLVYSRSIKKGEVLRSSDFTMRRPGGGLPWNASSFLVGRSAAKDLAEHDNSSYLDVL
jgi:N,N'-diacetyllegionaminate synthase